MRAADLPSDAGPERLPAVRTSTAVEPRGHGPSLSHGMRDARSDGGMRTVRAARAPAPSRGAGGRGLRGRRRSRGASRRGRAAGGRTEAGSCDAWFVRKTASVGAASAMNVRSSRSRPAHVRHRELAALACSVAIGVPGMTVSVSSETNPGPSRVASAAEAFACSSQRSTPPAPSRKIAESSIPAACAFRAASTCSAAVAPLAMRFSVTSSPDSGPM